LSTSICTAIFDGLRPVAQNEGVTGQETTQVTESELQTNAPVAAQSPIGGPATYLEIGFKQTQSNRLFGCLSLFFRAQLFSQGSNLNGQDPPFRSGGHRSTAPTQLLNTGFRDIRETLLTGLPLSLSLGFHD